MMRSELKRADPRRPIRSSSFPRKIAFRCSSTGVLDFFIGERIKMSNREGGDRQKTGWRFYAVRCVQQRQLNWSNRFV